MRFAKVFVFILATSASAAFASEAERCKTFVSADGKSFQLADAYKASELVVLGEVIRGKANALKIKHKIKGTDSSQEIQLVSNECHGTACAGGFSVAESVDLLFFLNRQADGKYNSVSGNGNVSCPVVFEEAKGMVTIGVQKVPVQGLKKYLESKPAAIPL